MTSAVQDVVKEDGVTPADPFDDGAGSIRADRAVNPTLVFDETYADFVASATDPLHRIDLNIASVDAPTMTGRDHDEADGDRTSAARISSSTVSIEAPAGATIIVSDKAPSPNGAEGRQRRST